MKKNILIVDDSALMRRVIYDIINSDSKFQAKDRCKDGLEAYEKLKTTKYDAVVLDINMPRMNGLELLEKLQQERISATVIVVSTSTDAGVTMLAMERGAVDFVAKPYNIIEAKGEDFKTKLLGVLNAVLNNENAERILSKTAKTPVKTLSAITETIVTEEKLIAIACSTGGPKALQSVIPYLPKNLDAPVVLVQHMPAGFTRSMAERLNEISEITVKEAEEGETLKKGCVYVAQGGFHMEIVQNRNGSHRISVNDNPAIKGLKPCADITYESLQKSGFNKIICVVLTGMGSDGTKGILSLQKKKPIHVIAQDAQTCVVYGMPKAIVEAGIANEVVPITEVAPTIIKNVGVH